MTEQPDLRTQVLERFRDATLFIDTLDEGDAAELAENCIDGVIAVLRRDKRWTAVSRFELEVLLGDVRRSIERDLHERLKGHSPYRETLSAAADAVVEMAIENRKARQVKAKSKGGKS